MTRIDEIAKNELAAAAERGAARRAKLNMHAPGEVAAQLEGKACPECRWYEGHSPTCELNKAVKAAAAPLHTMLDERGSRYGKFVDQAETTQDLKTVIFNRLRDKKLMPDQLEALEMIALKIGRIVNGDPDYEDSWRDIAGYATLVADRLKGEER